VWPSIIIQQRKGEQLEDSVRVPWRHISQQKPHAIHVLGDVLSLQLEAKGGEGIHHQAEIECAGSVSPE